MRRISKGIATLTMADAPQDNERGGRPALTTSDEVAWVAQGYPDEGPAGGRVDPPPDVDPEPRRRATHAQLSHARTTRRGRDRCAARRGDARRVRPPPRRPAVAGRPRARRGAADRRTVQIRATAPPVAQDELLDAYVAAAQPQLADVAASFHAKFSDIRITAVHPGTVQYDYVFAQQTDPTIAAAALDASIPTLKKAADSAVFPEMATGRHHRRPEGDVHLLQRRRDGDLDAHLQRPLGHASDWRRAARRAQTVLLVPVGVRRRACRSSLRDAAGRGWSAAAPPLPAAPTSAGR